MSALSKRLSIRNRIWSIVLILIGGFVLSGVVDVVMLRLTLLQEREAAIRQVVDGGHAVLGHFQSLESSGSLTRQAAQAAALGTIRAMRYNGNEYFWVNDDRTPPRMVMHPLMPELEGHTLLEEKFNRATGLRSGTDGPFVPTDGRKNLLAAFAEVVAASGHGYVTYSWPKALPGGASTAESFPKLSYVKAFAPWGWIIGSGIYVDDIDAAVRAQAMRNLLILLGVSALLLAVATLIARSITRPLQATMQAMHEIVESDAALGRRVAVDGPGEMVQLARNFNQMLDYIQIRDQSLLRHREHLEEEVATRTASLREVNLKLDAELAERKRVEQALRGSEEKFRGMARVAQDAIVMMDAQCNISFWNPAAEKIFGYTREEAVGQDLHALIAPERFYPAFRQAYQRFAEHGEGTAVGRTLELQARHKDGSELPIELSLSAIRLNDAWSAVGIARDISERKCQEQALQENLARLHALNQKLEAAQNQLLQAEKMASIGQLAAGVAHEINNPLGFVRSNLGALEDYVGDLLDIVGVYGKADPLLALQPDLQRVVEGLKQRANLDFLTTDIRSLIGESRDGIDRVARIVQDLKDFSRINSKDWAVAELERGLDSTLNVIASQIGEKAEVVKEYAGLPPVECLGSQMNQVFMTLLVNAAQAIERRGTITLRTGYTEDRVWVEVADTGKGIAPEDLKRIFDPFFTTKPVGQGTGLGLSVAYSIVRQHHGSLDVVSEPGQGSRFRIEIPRVQPKQPATVEAESIVA